MPAIDPGLFLAAAVLLSIERIAYAQIWQDPGAFRAWCAHPIVSRVGAPVDIVRLLCIGFKIIQAGVFFAWCYVHGDGHVRPSSDLATLAAGISLIGIGQTLNAAVFMKLGSAGVFYGNRFGQSLPWVSGFPFSLLRHPQYVGTVLTIWGLFAVMRFPATDWFALPLLETVYYALGSRAESERL